MMEPGRAGVIAAAALVTYATRIAGLSLGNRAVPPVLRRFLAGVPVAVFAALAAPGLGGADPELVPRLAAAVAASVAVLHFRRLWACLAAGLAVFWLTRWIV